MKDLKEAPDISTENKSKLLSKGNGITTILERVFHRSHEESDKIGETYGDGTEIETSEEISVFAEDHTSQYGTVKVVGSVKTDLPADEESETVEMTESAEVTDSVEETESVEVTDSVEDNEAAPEDRNGNEMKDEHDVNSAAVADKPELENEVPQPDFEAYPFQTEPGVEGPPYTYIPGKEDMETQRIKEETEFKNGDEFEHNVELDKNGGEDQKEDAGTPDETADLSADDLDKIESPLAFVKELKKQKPRPEKFLKRLEYEQTVEKLQLELAKLQRSVMKNGERVIVIFEGMDLSGKFSSIRTFTKYMDPRSVKVVSLRERSDDEKDQWYFQRYMDHLPGKGEIVFFNRSWYERGFIEPIHGMCTDHEYGQFLSQTPDFEYMLCEHGVKIIKIWLAVSADELEVRHAELERNPALRGSEGPIDESSRERWAEASKYRNIMFSWTDKSFSPWTIISADKKNRMRVQSMKHVLSSVDYEGKNEAQVPVTPDATLVRRFHRSMIKEMD